MLSGRSFLRLCLGSIWSQEFSFVSSSYGQGGDSDGRNARLAAGVGRSLEFRV